MIGFAFQQDDLMGKETRAGRLARRLSLWS